jgi:TetR/AcrR family transcriptional regulator, transcriptional repressor of bet genes
LVNTSDYSTGERMAKPKRIPEQARREQILEAAFRVACRESIGRLTVRAVAAEAGISHALVLFHFGRKARLVHDLLGWVLDSTSVLHISEDIARFPHARDRLNALLEQEMTRQSHQPEYTRLFLEYWALGAHHEEIRTQIGAELERYREAFRAIMAELLAADPLLMPGVTADGMAAVAVSWIQGCAVQALIAPEMFDTDDYLAALRGMMAPPGGGMGQYAES